MAGDGETQTWGKKGGLITFPFIIGSVGSLTLAGAGWLSNLTIYLINEFNVNTIDATLILNVVYGCISIFPVAAALIADSFFGCFSVIFISSCISLLGIIVFTLTATIGSLRPLPCDIKGTSICQHPSKLQYSILYLGIVLASMGFGGTRLTSAAFGANQYNNPKHQNVFFNWYIVTTYFAFVVSAIAIVYVQDNVSWVWGFAICITANSIGLAILLLGNRFYRRDKPQGSPLTALARVLVAAIRKSSTELPLTTDHYYYNEKQVAIMADTTLTKSLGCLNRAALITEGDVNLDGSIARPWMLCKVQQVEDFKALLRLFPLWSSVIFVSTPIAIHGSLTILQVLTMDRHLGPNFKISPGSFSVLTLISTSIFLTLIDRFLDPLWHKFIGKPLTPLQRAGIGHTFNVLAMAVSALVESKRLKIAHADHLSPQPDATVSMLSLWLFPQLILVGIGEAFHFPGHIALFYQEFPASLRSTATAMVSLTNAVAFYLSTTLIDMLRKVTGWLPDDINKGRLDNVYWIIFGIGVLNFSYFLVCAKCYKYQNYVETSVKGDSPVEN